MQKRRFQTTPQDIGQRLDHFLWEAQQRHSINHDLLSRSEIRRLIVAGGVYWNRKRVRIASKPVIYPLMLEWFWDPQKSNRAHLRNRSGWVMTDSDVLYHQKGILVVNKPIGLPSQPTLDEAREHVGQKVKEFLNLAYLGWHHRLDRDTSGALLFTTDRSQNEWVASLFQSHHIRKTYLAIASRPQKRTFPRQWTLQNYLGPKTQQGKKVRFGAVSSGGLWAETDFSVKAILEDVVWLEVQPKTGRTHQIRAHLAEYGLPLVGDSFYGYQGPPYSHFFLHAWRLSWPSQSGQEGQMSLEAPLPEAWSIWLKRFHRTLGP